MDNSIIVYNLYSNYMKDSICDCHKESPINFINEVVKELKLNYEIKKDNTILFYAVLGKVRIESFVNYSNKNFTNQNIKCRFINYNKIWENKNWNNKYIICSDMNYDKKHIIT